MTADHEVFLTQARARLDGLRERCRQALRDMDRRREVDADELASVRARLEGRIARAEALVDRADRRAEPVSPELRNDVDVACAELRIDVAGLEVCARDYGRAGGV